MRPFTSAMDQIPLYPRLGPGYMITQPAMSELQTAEVLCYLELVEGLGAPGGHAASEAEAVMTGGQPQGEHWPLLPQGADLASHTHVRG